MRTRLVLIAASVAGMVLIVSLLGPALHRPSHEQLRPSSPDGLAPIAAEAVMFRPNTVLDSLARLGVGVPPRRLSDRASRRAYPGAPPTIPHPLTSQELREGSCGSCHAIGGYVARFAAYAPPTPHPEMASCLQCHVPQKPVPLFVETAWQSESAPSIGQAAMVGAPPAIPHALQMRENCLACHGSAAAAPEIRTTHPERIHCRQCHMVRNEVGEFVRMASAGAVNANGAPR